MKHFDSIKEKYNHIFKGAKILINFLRMHHPNFTLEIINPKFFFTIYIYIYFQVVKFISDVFKTFVNTLCYNNDENCDLFKL
jgi:hypothetical protein